MTQKKILARDTILLAEISSTADPNDPTFAGSYKPVGMCQEVSLDIDIATLETSHKNSGTTKTYDYDMVNATGSMKGILHFVTSGIGSVELEAAAVARKKVKFVLVTKKDNASMDEETAILTADIDSDKFLQGSPTKTFVALITKVSDGAPNEGNATYDISFQVTGAITNGTVPAAV